MAESVKQQDPDPTPPRPPAAGERGLPRPNHTWIPFKLIPRAINAPNPPHLSTVARWTLIGVGNPRVKLGTLKCGGKRYSTREMIEAFIAATSGGKATGADPAEGREAAIRKAEQDLDADGV